MINSPQALAGSTPLLDPPATLTHAEPAPAASAWAAPTGTRAVTWLVAGSTRDTVLSFQFATHTAPSPNATYRTPAPTSIVRSIGLGPGSTRHSTPSSEVAHTAPPPTAMPNSWLLPSSIALRMRFVRGSICAIVFSPEITQTPASPAAIGPTPSVPGPRRRAGRSPDPGARPCCRG